MLRLIGFLVFTLTNFLMEGCGPEDKVSKFGNTIYQNDVAFTEVMAMTGVYEEELKENSEIHLELIDSNDV